MRNSSEVILLLHRLLHLECLMWKPLEPFPRFDKKNSGDAMSVGEPQKMVLQGGSGGLAHRALQSGSRWFSLFLVARGGLVE